MSPDNSTPTPTHPGTPLPQPLLGLRVLVVEDDAINREILAKVLGLLGADHAIAGDGFEALQQLMLAHFDVILMDLQLPRMDGLETTRRIRSGEEAAGSPPALIVALTAGTGEQDALRAEEAGMDGLLLKPVRMQELSDAIVTLLADRNAAATGSASGSPADDQRATFTPAPAAPVVRPDTVVLDALPLFVPQVVEDLDSAVRASDPKLVETLICNLVRDMPTLLERMNEALDLDEPEECGLLAHKLIARAGNLGAKRMQESARTLQDFCKKRRDDTAAQRNELLRLNRIWNETRPEYIQRWPMAAQEGAGQ